MPVLDRRIGLKDVRALMPGESVWDGGAEGVGGFHARRQQSKTVSYVVAYRTADGRQRWQTIGRHGSPWTPDTARDAAKRILGHVVEGADPAAEKRSKRKAATVGELCDLYLADAEAGRLLTRGKAAKKASTLATDKALPRAVTRRWRGIDVGYQGARSNSRPQDVRPKRERRKVHRLSQVAADLAQMDGGEGLKRRDGSAELDLLKASPDHWQVMILPGLVGLCLSLRNPPPSLNEKME